MLGMQKIKTKKAGDHVYLSYVSVLTGKRRRLTKKETGQLPTEEAAKAWAAEHLPALLRRENELLERQQWRRHADIVVHANHFEAFKKLNQPKSWQQVTGALENYVLPYFVIKCGLKNPNTWGAEAQKFKSWLLTEDAFDMDGAMSVSTANKAINSYNKFCEWLRDHARVLDWNNCRVVDAYPSVMLKRRGAEDLLEDNELAMLVGQLSSVDELYAEMVLVQRHTGMRVGELAGLSLLSLTTKIPDMLQQEFKAIGCSELFGAVYLDSQPRDPYIKRIDGEIPRKPLKWRPEIAPKYARTIPVSDKIVWNILARRFSEQRIAFNRGDYGPKKESYLLFDNVQRNHYLSAIREAYQSLGLRPKGSHSLRHTRITELTVLKLPDKIQELVMGHKGLAQQRYQHLVELLNRRTQQDQDFTDINIVA